MSDIESLARPAYRDSMARFLEKTQMPGTSVLPWRLLSRASKDAAAWAGIVVAASLVLKQQGKSADAMEAFFTKLSSRPHDEDWLKVAVAAGTVASIDPKSILESVKSVLIDVPVSDCRNLVHLHKVDYCLHKYRDDPVKLAECLAED